MVVETWSGRASWWPGRTSPTPTPTAGAASTPSSTGPPSSGSAPWTPSRTPPWPACEGIQWHPAWGKERMISMISERSDWCISRQRVWGVPIPIFYCDGCGADIVTPETIAHVAALFRKDGSNVWFDREAGICCRRASSAPSAAKPTSPRRPTSWMCGSTPLHLGRRSCGAPLPEVSRRPLPGGRRPVPGLVPVLHTHLHRPSMAWLPTGRSPPTAGPWTARARPCTSPWATPWALRRSSRSMAPTCSAVGGLRRLHPGHAHLQGHHEAALQAYLKIRNTARYMLGKSGGLRPRPGPGALRGVGGAGSVRPGLLQQPGEGGPGGL